MPWFDPQPSAAQRDFWILPAGQPHKVSLWPSAGSNRTDARFRMRWTPGVFPTAQTWIFHLTGDPGGPPPQPDPLDLWGWFELNAVGVDDLRASVAAGPDGLSVEVLYQDVPNGFTSGVPATNLTFNVEEGSGETLDITFEYLPPPAGAGWKPKIDSDVDSPDFETYNDSFGWPWVNNHLRVVSLSDCYSFPPIGVPGPVGASVIANELIANDNDSFPDIAVPPGFALLQGMLRLRGGTTMLPGVGVQLGRSGVVDTSSGDYRWKFSNYGNSSFNDGWQPRTTFAIDRANLVPHLTELTNKWFVGNFFLIGGNDSYETTCQAWGAGDGLRDRYAVLGGYHTHADVIDTVRIHDYQSSQGWAAGSNLVLIGFD